MLNFKTLPSCFLSSGLVFSFLLPCLLISCNPSKNNKAGEGFVEVTELFFKKYQGEYFQESLGNLSVQKAQQTSPEKPQKEAPSLRDTYKLELNQIQESKHIDWNQELNELSWIKNQFNLLSTEEKNFFLSQSFFACVQKSRGLIYSVLENFQKEFRSDKFPYMPDPAIKEKILALHEKSPERRYYIIISSAIHEQIDLLLSPKVISSNIEIPALNVSTLPKSENASNFLYYLKMKFCPIAQISPKKDLSWDVIPTQVSTAEDGKYILNLEITKSDSPILFPQESSKQEKSSQENNSKLRFYQIKN